MTDFERGPSPIKSKLIVRAIRDSLSGLQVMDSGTYSNGMFRLADVDQWGTHARTLRLWSDFLLNQNPEVHKIDKLGGRAFFLTTNDPPNKTSGELLIPWETLRIVKAVENVEVNNEGWLMTSEFQEHQMDIALAELGVMPSNFSNRYFYKVGKQYDRRRLTFVRFENIRFEYKGTSKAFDPGGMVADANGYISRLQTRILAQSNWIKNEENDDDRELQF